MGLAKYGVQAVKRQRGNQQRRVNQRDRKRPDQRGHGEHECPEREKGSDGNN